MTDVEEAQLDADFEALMREEMGTDQVFWTAKVNAICAGCSKEYGNNGFVSARRRLQEKLDQLDAKIKAGVADHRDRLEALDTYARLQAADDLIYLYGHDGATIRRRQQKVEFFAEALSEWLPAIRQRPHGQHHEAHRARWRRSV